MTHIDFAILNSYILGPYIYHVHKEGGWGSLEICHVFADSTVFTTDLLFIFANGGGRGVTKLVIFCGRRKQMTPFKMYQKRQLSYGKTENIKTAVFFPAIYPCI